MRPVTLRSRDSRRALQRRALVKETLPTRPSSRGKPMLLLVASVLLGACAGSPHRASHGELRFVDTETAGRLRHAAAVGRGAGGLAPAASNAAAVEMLNVGTAPPPVPHVSTSSSGFDELSRTITSRSARTRG